MSDVAIRVENLGKRYRRGLPAGNDRLSEVLVNAARGLISFPRRLAARFHPPTEPNAPPPDRAGEFWALKDVNFEVKRGEVVGVIGRNGAGKSTLLKVLSRITEPTAGRFGVAGRVASLLEVGTGFHGELTGRENVFLSGSLLGMSRAEVRRKFDEIAAFAEVDGFLDTPVKRYSSGMQMRLGFAVAAHLEPDILIVDEVLAVGDAAFQKKCLGKMQDVVGQGRTVLFVSHQMTAVTTLCSRAVWMNQGRVRRDGTVPEVAREYASGEAAGRVRRWDDQATAPSGGGVTLREIKVSPADERPDDTITLDDPVELTVTADVLEDGLDLNLAVIVSTADGVTAFVSNSPSRPTTAGRFVARTTIPGGLFNDIAYSLSVFVVRDESQILVSMADAVRFEVIELARDSTWHGKWSGAVRPRLVWQTHQAADQ